MFISIHFGGASEAVSLLPNHALERTAGSSALAAAAHRQRWAARAVFNGSAHLSDLRRDITRSAYPSGVAACWSPVLDGQASDPRHSKAYGPVEASPFVRLVFTDTPTLHDPELPLDLSPSESGNQCSYCVKQVLLCWLGRKTKYGTAGVVRGREEKWVPEIKVQGDYAPALTSAGSDEGAVGR